MRRYSPHLAAGVLALLAGLSARALEPLTEPTAADLRRLIKPTAGEDRWQRIPWLTSLWEARKRAAAQGKPILLWEMDGHPLGCT